MARDRLEGFIARLRQRVQGLLSERYGLVIRAETREMPVYSLGVGKGGHKLAPSSEERRPILQGTGRHEEQRRQYEDARGFAFSGGATASVVDDTGLTGVYDLKMELTSDPQPGEPADAGGPSIFTAIQEQLGLRLEAKKRQRRWS